ncbi:MAG TPA: type II toxin-antitoxin system HicB family antitoxin [Nitrososphaera sp.]|jgi:predicted RNase H-like HicB family nuclease
MKPFQDDPLTVHYILKDKDGTYVGHCVEIPAIVVYGSTQDEVEGELQKAISSYFVAFPEQRKTIKQEEVKQLVVTI